MHAAKLLILLSGLVISALANPSDKPIQLIESVAHAAREHNLAILARYMADDFRYSFGGNASKAEALEYFRAYPAVLEKIAPIIEQGCAPVEYRPGVSYVCPPAFADFDVNYFGYRAIFSKNTNGEWVFQMFIAGD